MPCASSSAKRGSFVSAGASDATATMSGSSGCSEVMLVSDVRWALMRELRGAPEPALEECIARISPCDLLLVEGFKHAPIPKLEVWRAATGEPLLHPNDAHIVGVASDAKVATKLPLLSLDDDAGIAQFILRHVELA